MTELSMDFSALFDDPFLSDFRLALVGPNQNRLKEYAVHGVVLAGHSPYFKALIKSWLSHEQRLLELHISDSEQAGAERMLQCAYSGSVGDATAEELLACMVLADRYQFHFCVERCRQTIMDMDSTQLPWDSALALLQLPRGLRENPSFRPLEQKAHERVWADFSSLDTAWRDAQLRSKFQQLPAEAVRHLLQRDELRVVSENVVFIAVATWAAYQEAAIKAAKVNGALPPHAAAAQEASLTAATRQLLAAVRFPHLTGSFMTAVVARHPLFKSHPDSAVFLLEALQYSMGKEAQQKALEKDKHSSRFRRREAAADASSAFTCYFRYADLRQALTKYDESGRKEAYYLLTGSHFYNGYVWRLKLTVKPPDEDSPHPMNIHVGLCYGCEVDGEPVLLPEGAQVVVDFDIATWDFVLQEEDPTSSEGDVVIRSGTCWGWDDFMGPEVYAEDSDTAWSKFMNTNQELLLSCHIYSCS